MSDKHYVNVVLIRCLSANAPYMPGHVVDHGCDIPIESYVVHSTRIERSKARFHGLVVTLFLSSTIEMPLVYEYWIT